LTELFGADFPFESLAVALSCHALALKILTASGIIQLSLNLGANAFDIQLDHLSIPRIKSAEQKALIALLRHIFRLELVGKSAPLDSRSIVLDAEWLNSQLTSFDQPIQPLDEKSVDKAILRGGEGHLKTKLFPYQKAAVEVTEYFFSLS
jgi:hypothetical protein